MFFDSPWLMGDPPTEQRLGGDEVSGRRAKTVVLTELQASILGRLERADRTPQGLAERCRIVLLAAEGRPSVDVAAELDVDPQRVSRWRNRWEAAQAALLTAENEQVADSELEALIRRLLADLHRNGGVTKFSAEQVAQIIALACEAPADSDLPVTHWTPAELAREAVKRGIVGSISPRQVDRFLKGGRSSAAQEPVLAHVAGQARSSRALPGRRREHLRDLQGYASSP